MTHLATTARAFLQDERGATAIEYALIIGGIAAVIIGAVNALGVTLAQLYTDVEAGF